jgi:hypothetical protein
MARLGGEGDPRSIAGIPHHLQYTIVRWVGSQDQDSTLVWGTENMSDGDVLAFLRRESNFEQLRPLAQRFLRTTGRLPEGERIQVERYDCCYLCLERSPCAGIREERTRLGLLDGRPRNHT